MPRPDTGRKPITLRLRPEVAAWIRAEALRQGRSLSDVVEDLLRRQKEDPLTRAGSG